MNKQSEKSLIYRLLSLTIIVCITGIMYLYFAPQEYVLSNFKELEINEFQLDISRIINSIKRENQFIESFVKDWSEWTDTYYFVEDHNQNYIKDNLYWEYIEGDQNLNLLYIVDNSREIVWGESFDFQIGYLDIEGMSSEDTEQINQIIDNYESGGVAESIISTLYGPLMIAINPITDSLGEYESNGYLIMGRLLDTGFLIELVKHTNLDFGVYLGEIPSNVIDFDYKGENNVYINKDSSDTIYTYIEIESINGDVNIIKLNWSRDIMIQGQAAAIMVRDTLSVAFVILIVLVLLAIVSYILKVNYTKHLLQLKLIDKINSLKLSEKRYETLFENAFDAFYILDYNFNVLDCNKVAHNRLGYSKSDIISVSLWDLSSDEFEYDEDTILNQIEYDDSYQFETIHLSEDKVSLNIDVILQRINYKSKNALLAVARDISAVKDYQSKLEVAKEKAEIASKAKSTFLSNMSHEIRTPMNAILGYSQLMKRESNLNESQMTNLNIINKSGTHLLALINDILEMSQIEAGKAIIKERNFDLYSLVSEIIMMFQLRAKNKGFLVRFEATKAFPRVVRSDENKVRQILINIVGNSIKFTESGQVVIFLDAVHEKNNIHVIIDVKDTGYGIAENEFDKVFESFDQTESSRVKGGGSGLGMPISKKYAKLLNGDLNVLESKIGVGSTFRFEFDTVNVEGDEVIDLVKTTKQVKHLAPYQKFTKILVVDDVLENRNLLLKMLESIGFNVSLAENGREAVDKYQLWRPDIILMDIVMPVMNGYEATQEIRKLVGGKDISIIFVTASVLDEEKEHAFSHGANGFIRKPFDDNLLLEEIRRVSGVEYVYEDDTVEAKDFSEPKSFDHIPFELLKELYISVENGEMKQINSLIEDINKHDVLLGSRLKDYKEKYDYESIIDILSEGVENGIYAQYNDS